jgi:sensor c-di-GMP phosphodiesterase-like protein
MMADCSIQILLEFAMIFVVSGAVAGGFASTLLAVWVRRRRTLPMRLQRAIRQEGLIMLYQPVVSVASGEVVGAEALVRWPVQPSGQIKPSEFIPIAEAVGLIGHLTCFAIRTVSKQFGDFLRFHRGFTVSINIVASDLFDKLFHDTLYAYVEEQDIPPSQIALELSERRAGQVEAADIVIKRLRRIGYKVYIADFGTGHSNLSYLSDLPIDAVKLDKSFTTAIGAGTARAGLVPPIMKMAQEIGVKVIVAGVETGEQAALFQDYGASAMQGWLFGQACPAIDIIRRVERIAAQAL